MDTESICSGTNSHEQMIFQWIARKSIVTSLAVQINFQMFHMLNALKENGSHDGLW